MLAALLHVLHPLVVLRLGAGCRSQALLTQLHGRPPVPVATCSPPFFHTTSNAPLTRAHASRPTMAKKPAGGGGSGKDAAATPLRDVAGGVNITVRAKPGAKQCSISLGAEAVEVAVNAPAREGEANAAILEYVAEVLGVRKGAVRLQMGGKGRDKVVFVEGMGLEHVRARLEAATSS